MATVALDVAAPAERIWAVLADGWSYAEWVVGAHAIRDVDAGYPAPGTRLHHRIGTAVAAVDDVTTVVDADPMRSLALHAYVRPLGEAAITFRLSPSLDGRRTTVTMSERAVGDEPGSVLGRRLDVALRVRNTLTLWRLKRRVEDRPATRLHGLAGAGGVIVRLSRTVARSVADLRPPRPGGDAPHS